MDKTALLVFALLTLAACDPPRRRVDAASPSLDAAVAHDDAYVAPGTDAALDAPVIAVDAYLPPTVDAYVPPSVDAYVPPTPDAYVAPTPDAYVARDAFVSSAPCDQIAAIRATSGPLSPSLPVTGAVVSYVMPVLPVGATDPRGVFVQCPGSSGPALFLAIDPTDGASFPTAPRAGDVVSFSVRETLDTTTTGGTGDQHRVLSISGWTVTGTGSVAAQDVTAVALPAVLESYESELVTIEGDVASSGMAAGTGFTSFQITTSGVPTATVDLRLRVPVDLATSLGLAAGCHVRVSSTPLWRYTTAAQPSAFSASEISVSGCPAGCTPPSHLVINEMDYDQPSTDTAEFVEIHNPTASSINLAGYALVAVDGSSATEYARVALSGSIAPFGYVVVTATGSTVAGATFTLPATMQNGPDGFVLLGPGNAIVDAAMYEGVITSVTLAAGAGTLSISESASVGTDPSIADTGLSRRPNGCDRDTPAADWASAAITPGAPN